MSIKILENKKIEAKDWTICGDCKDDINVGDLHWFTKALVDEKLKIVTMCVKCAEGEE